MSEPVRKDAFTREWRIHLFIGGILALAFFPLYLMLNISLKDNSQFMLDPWLPHAPFHFENWGQAWVIVGRYISNTVFVAVTTVALTFGLTLPASYFFARYRPPCYRLLWYFFIILMLMPGVASLIPLFLLIKGMGLLNSLMALVVLGVAGAQVFQIFILRNFIEDIPGELFEAAEMDGAGHIAMLRNVVIPMSGSIISTLAILQLLGVWNDFLMPMLLIADDEKLTLAAGLIKLDGEYVKQWGPMMAGYSIAAIPLVVIFLFTMRLFVKGLAAGAIKG